MFLVITAELQHDGMRFTEPRDGGSRLGPSLRLQAATPAAGRVGSEPARSQVDPAPLTAAPALPPGLPRPEPPQPCPTGGPRPRVSHLVVEVQHGSHGAAAEPRRAPQARPYPCRSERSPRRRTNRNRAQAPRGSCLPGPAPEPWFKVGLKSFDWGLFFLVLAREEKRGPGEDPDPGLPGASGRFLGSSSRAAGSLSHRRATVRPALQRGWHRGTAEAKPQGLCPCKCLN